MTYKIAIYNTETDQFDVIATTENQVRVTSDRYVEHVVFESDDPEWNG